MKITLHCEVCGKVLSIDERHFPVTCCGVKHHLPGSPQAKVKTCGAVFLGPGTALGNILHQLGAKPTSSCGCEAKINEMNCCGVEWCKEHRQEIIGHLATAYIGLTWAEVGNAVAAATASGLALRIYPWDVCGSLVDLAIARAEAAELERAVA